MMRLGVASPFSNFITSSVPVGQKGLVHIWGQNNTTLEQKLGISWTVRDPDGLLVERHADDWSGNITPGKAHEFIGGRFEFFKEGIYTIDVSLFMNPYSPSVVDSYKGVLCTVVAEAPPVPPVPPEEEEEEVAFPWLPVMLIGGGLVLVATTMVKPEKAKT